MKSIAVTFLIVTAILFITSQESSRQYFRKDGEITGENMTFLKISKIKMDTSRYPFQ